MSNYLAPLVHHVVSTYDTTLTYQESGWWIGKQGTAPDGFTTMPDKYIEKYKDVPLLLLHTVHTIVEPIGNLYQHIDIITRNVADWYRAEVRAGNQAQVMLEVTNYLYKGIYIGDSKLLHLIVRTDLLFTEVRPPSGTHKDPGYWHSLSKRQGKRANYRL